MINFLLFFDEFSGALEAHLEVDASWLTFGYRLRTDLQNYLAALTFC